MTGPDGRLRALIAASGEKSAQALLALLPPEEYVSAVAQDGAEARRLLKAPGADIVLVNAPLADEPGPGLALEICREAGAGVLLLVKAEQYAALCPRLAPQGVLVLPKPAPARLLSQAVPLLRATRERLRKMERETASLQEKTASLQEKMDEIRLINRAKCVLIEQLKMTEQEAHRFIEKQAMDRCVSRRAIAEKLLATYQ